MLVHASSHHHFPVGQGCSCVLFSTGNEPASPTPGSCSRIEDFGERKRPVVPCAASHQDMSVGQKSCGMSSASFVHPAGERPEASGRIPKLRSGERVICACRLTSCD